MDETAKRAVIIGAAGGIGEAGARRLALEGWRLALVDIEAERIERVGGEVGAVSVHVAADADADALAAAVDAAIGELGGLDAAWSNQGVQCGGGIEELRLDDLDLSYAVNLRAHAVIARQALPSLNTVEAITAQVGPARSKEKRRKPNQAQPKSREGLRPEGLGFQPAPRS